MFMLNLLVLTACTNSETKPTSPTNTGDVINTKVDTDTATDTAIDTSTNIDPSFLVGKTYVLDFSQANFIKPAVNAMILDLLIAAPLLIGITSETDSGLTLLGAVKKNDNTQDLCETTVGLPTAHFSTDASFVAGPQDVVSGASMPMNALILTGTFSHDGSHIENVTLSGTLDARDIAREVSGLNDNEDQICDAMQNANITCQPCPDGPSYCVEVVAENLSASELPITLIPIAAKDCPGCEAGEPVCE